MGYPVIDIYTNFTLTLAAMTFKVRGHTTSRVASVRLKTSSVWTSATMVSYTLGIQAGASKYQLLS